MTTHRSTPGIVHTTLALLALGSLLALAVRAVQRTHGHRVDGRSAPLPPRLQTWEGEGGRPDTGEGSDAAVAATAPG